MEQDEDEVLRVFQNAVRDYIVSISSEHLQLFFYLPREVSDFGPPKKDGEFLFFDFSDTNLVNPLKFSKLSPPKY